MIAQYEEQRRGYNKEYADALKAIDAEMNRAVAADKNAFFAAGRIAREKTDAAIAKNKKDHVVMDEANRDVKIQYEGHRADARARFNNQIAENDKARNAAAARNPAAFARPAPAPEAMPPAYEEATGTGCYPGTKC